MMGLSTTTQGLKKRLGYKKYDLNAWTDYLFYAESVTSPKVDSQIDEIRNTMRDFHKAGSSKPHDGQLNQQQGVLDELFKHLHPDQLVEYAEKHYDRKDETALRKAMRNCRILVTTANDVERNILHYKINKLNNDGKITRILFGNVAYFVFQWGSYQVAHVHQHEISGNRNLGMHATLQEVLRVVRPNVVFSLGVAFGISPKSQNVGDVLVSHRILPYSENKIVDDNLYPDRSQDLTIDKWLDVRFANTPGFLENVTYGSILSGSSVLSSAWDKARICRAYSKNDFVIGGEMEGQALFQFCGSYDIPCAVIKGICDWAALKNGIYQEKTEPEKAELEDHLKTCAQAYAMTQVVDACQPLFNDGTLFSHPKTRAADAEREKSRLLTMLMLLTDLIMLLLGSYILTRTDVPCNTPLIGSILISAACLSFCGCAITHYSWEKRYLRYPGK